MRHNIDYYFVWICAFMRIFVKNYIHDDDVNVDDDVDDDDLHSKKWSVK